MADEDIVIGADVSGGVKGLGNLRHAAEELGRQMGLTEKQVTSMGNSLDRTFATAVGQAVRLASAEKQAATAGTQNAKSLQTQADAARKLAAEQERVYAAMGLSVNAGGRVVDANTGRFASKEQITTANSYIRTLKEINDAEELVARTQAARAASALRYNQEQVASIQKMAPAIQIGSAEWVNNKQLQAMALMRTNIDNIAATTPKMLGLRDILAGIPPVTMAEKLNKVAAGFLDMDNSSRYALYSVANGAGIAGAAILGFGVMATKAAIDHERAFANVKRTTQTTAEGYEQLRLALQAMAMELPVSYKELTEIASAAGQLGIQASGVENFTKTVAMLTATTNLSSDAAGNALARFKAFFSQASDPSLAVSESTFSNLASSILRVGINSIATESSIVNVSTQISSMGKYAGLTANQVIGLSGALASVGVAPELARGITTRLFTIIGDAASASGVQLEKFAALSGMSAEQFKASWGTESFAQTFTSLLKGLASVEAKGGDANSVLRDLGITAVRDRPVWLRLADAASSTGEKAGLLAETLADAEKGWRENIELAVQYGKISQTTSARLQVMAQAFEQLFASMGEQTGGFVGDLAKMITDVVKGFEAFSRTDAGKVMGSIAIQASAVIGVLLLTVGAAAGTAASLQAVGEAYRKMGDSATTGATKVQLAAKIMSLGAGIFGIITTVALMAGTFIAMGDAADKAKKPVSDMAGLLSAMKTDAENGASGIKFYSTAADDTSASAVNAREKADGLSNALYGIKGSSESAADGLDKTGKKAKEVAGIYGQSARDFIKSQLLQNEKFQKLFDPSELAVQGLQKFGLTTSLINWDKVIEQTVKEGGNAPAEIARQLAEQANSKGIGQGSEQWAAINIAIGGYAKVASESLGNVNSDIQGQIDAQNALAGNTNATVNQMIDDYELLDDVSKKTVDDMAAGFAKFTASDTLIKLTQKMNEIFAGPDTDSAGNAIDKAAQWEQAWSDAYGGAAFSIESYLAVFQRAADQQNQFYQQLNQLSARGLSSGIIDELAKMGPEATQLVQALVNGTDEQLQQYEELWGRTGFDSMVKLATQTAIGQEIVRNVMKAGGLDALRAFNDSMASGSGVKEALAKLQLDIDGNPIKPKIADPADDWRWRFQNKLNNNPLSLPVSPYLTQSKVKISNDGSNIAALRFGGFAEGGFTGTGGKYDPAGIVHRGEFVMPQESVKAIGLNNLYAMMRATRGARSAPRGRGYADGGYVNGSRGSISVVELSAYDRQLLAAAGNVQLSIDGRVVAEASNRANFVATTRGSN